MKSNQSLGFQSTSLLAWAGFTFCSHFSAKLWLSEKMTTEESLASVAVLSTLQVAFGLLFSGSLCLLKGKFRELRLDKDSMVLGMCHAYGTVLTNGSMATANATLTHLIKMAEPLFTMLGMILITSMKMDLRLFLIMVLVTVSACGSQPVSEMTGSSQGAILALGSNTLYAIRNIQAKIKQSGHGASITGFASISLSALIALFPIQIGLTVMGSMKLARNSLIGQNMYMLCISSISHCAYSMISITVILAAFDPLQHALLNTVKRMVIVAAFALLTMSNWNFINMTCAIFSMTLSVLGTHYKQLPAFK